MNLSPDTARREIHEATTKVLEAIHQSADFNNQLKLSSGLKSMTAKQFLMIVQHFAHEIMGRDVTTIDKGDPANELVNFLKDINCPFNVTKSLFKAPTALHAYDTTIRTLGWMSEFVPKQTPIENLNQFNGYDGVIGADERHPNAMYTNKFNERVIDGFHLWDNNQDGEYQQLVQELVNEEIGYRLQNAVNSEETLENKTKDLLGQIVELKKLPPIIKNQQTFQVAEEKFNQLDFMVADLGNVCDTANDEVSAVKLCWQTRKQGIENILDEVNQMKCTIETQRFNVNQLDDLKMQEREYKCKLNAERSSLENLEANGNELKIEKARLISVNAKALVALRTYLSEMIKLFNGDVFKKYKCVVEFKQLVESPKGIEANLDALLKLKTKIDLMLNETICTLRKTEHENQLDLNEMKLRLITQAEQQDNLQDEYVKINNQLKADKRQYTIDKLRTDEELATAEKEFNEQKLFTDQMFADFRQMRTACDRSLNFRNEMMTSFEKLTREIIEMKSVLSEKYNEMLDTLDMLDRQPTLSRKQYLGLKSTELHEFLSAYDLANDLIRTDAKEVREEIQAKWQEISEVNKTINSYGFTRTEPINLPEFPIDDMIDIGNECRALYDNTKTDLQRTLEEYRAVTRAGAHMENE